MTFVSKRRAPFVFASSVFVLLALAAPGCGSDDDTTPGALGDEIATSTLADITTGSDSTMAGDGPRGTSDSGDAGSSGDANAAFDAEGGPTGPLSRMSIATSTTFS